VLQERDLTLKYFQQAAEKLKAMQNKEIEATEEQILLHLKIWCEE